METGLNSASGFAQGAISETARTELPFVEARNHFEAQSSRHADCFLSVPRAYVGALAKIVNDIRWLGAGPRWGWGGLKLPAVRPGSSSTWGEVNPVVAESLLMIWAWVIGRDAVMERSVAWRRCSHAVNATSSGSRWSAHASARA